MLTEQISTTAILHFLPFGPRTNARLFTYFHSAEAIWQANEQHLQQALAEQRGSQSLISKFISWRQTTTPSQLFDDLSLHHLDVLTRHDERYPAALQTLTDPPLGLFVQGRLPPTHLPLVSLVGSRSCTGYGLICANKLAHDLAVQGIGVVSGLALGIDEAAHYATVKAGGYTLGVLAHGHNKLTGRQQLLAQAILNSGGGLLSEYPPHVKGEPFRFPIRNRIIAGLSQGTVVIEAKIASGTLITAHAALENSREVFAVPGPINAPTSDGANQLIKNGAHVATCADDILDALNVHLPFAKPHPQITAIPTGQTPLEQRLIDLLITGQHSVDELARAAGQSTAQLLNTLTSLELAGKVRRLGNMEYGL